MALETNAGAYPVYFAATPDNKVANWRPLAHGIMSIPHLIIGSFLGMAAGFCQFIAWFAILITGKLPEGLANFMMMALRYNMRANTFYLGLTEQYPPFEFASTAGDPGDFPIRLDFTPELEGRNRLTVFFRFIMIIPLMFMMMFVAIGVYVVVIIAWFAVLFTGRYPEGMRNFVLKFFRFMARVQGYGSLLTDQYPPFALE